VNHNVTLEAIARRAMIEKGLEPDFPADARRELARLPEATGTAARDLRSLPWSSIDNDDSRDLDQLEVCVKAGMEAGVDAGPTRVLVAIADVDALVEKDGPLDAHARRNTTSVYTAARIFPMLPEELSTDRTSLNENEDRLACVVDMVVTDEGEVVDSDVYRALVHNHAKLTYNAVAAWLEGTGPPSDRLAAVPDLEKQLRLQDRLATGLRARRQREGALDFDRTEVKPVMDGGRVSDLRTEQPNRARDLIESFMVAANGATARYLSSRGFPSIRRVVRSPERWGRIVEIAAGYGHPLPPEPNALSLEQFLRARRAAAPDDFSDLSLSVIKLLGRGEYVADAAVSTLQHFALAVSNYTHSTAPNRRFADLVTERLVKAAAAGESAPYGLAELTVLAEHCTKQEDAANKVERLVRKAAAALWLSNRIGEQFDAVVTGASSKGTWVRLTHPPIEGRLDRGFEGLDVGDRLRVRLVRTDPERGFIDFARA